jgi:hypothetical protein
VVKAADLIVRSIVALRAVETRATAGRVVLAIDRMIGADRAALTDAAVIAAEAFGMLAGCADLG